MSEPLVIVGAGGFGREVAMAAENCNPPWSVRGFLDDRDAESLTVEDWPRLE